MKKNLQESRLHNLHVPLLLIVLFIFPLIIVPNSWPHTIIIRYLIFICFIILGIILLPKNSKNINIKDVLPLGLFVFFVFLSSLFSQYPFEAWIGTIGRFTGFISYIGFIVLFFLAYNVSVMKPQNINKIISNWMFPISLISVIGLLQYLGLNLVPFSNNILDVSKSYSTIGNSNHLGTFLLMPLPFAVYFFFQHLNVKSVIYLILIYGTLLTTLCRGAWIGLFAGFFLWVFYYKDQKKKRLILFTLILIIVTIILLPLNNWGLVNQAMSFSDEAELALEGDGEAGSGRFYIWQNATKALPDSLLLGTGPDTLVYIYPEGYKEFYSFNKAHNIYLEIAVTMGIPALIFYLWFIIAIVKRTNKQDEFHFAFYVMVMIYLVQGFFLVDVLTVYPIFWILLGFYQGLNNSS